MIYTFYRSLAGTQYPMCGNGNMYQVNIQQTLNPTIQLLSKTPEGEPGHDDDLNALVEAVNTFFAVKASTLLKKKRKDLEQEGHPKADRLEVTILLTDQGLQLAYDIALERKEVAPVPRKSLRRRLFGWMWFKKYWVMPVKAAADMAAVNASTSVSTPGTTAGKRATGVVKSTASKLPKPSASKSK